jgi:hypothetical protein
MIRSPRAESNHAPLDPNPPRSTDPAAQAVAASNSRPRLGKPVAVDEEGVVRAGHARVEAALNLRHLPIRVEIARAI